MLYISSKIRENVYTVCDSDTLETFEVVQSFLDSSKFYRDWHQFSMGYILGYVSCTLIVPVPRYVAKLLEYIESIIYIYDYEVVEPEFHVCKINVTESSKENIVCSTSRSGISVFDMIVTASYREGFTEAIKYGVLDLNFGMSIRDCFRVKFCGDYVPAIMKLVTVYRESDEFQCKVCKDSFGTVYLI